MYFCSLVASAIKAKNMTLAPNECPINVKVCPSVRLMASASNAPVFSALSMAECQGLLRYSVAVSVKPMALAFLASCLEPTATAPAIPLAATPVLADVIHRPNLTRFFASQFRCQMASSP